MFRKASRGALGVARRRKPSQERGMRRGALSIPARWVVPRRGMQALGPKVQQRALTGSQCEPLPNDPGWAGGFLSLITQPAALACWLGDAVSVLAGLPSSIAPWLAPGSLEAVCHRRSRSRSLGCVSLPTPISTTRVRVGLPKPITRMRKTYY